MKQGSTHGANIGVLCNVQSHSIILLGQRHTEQQSITGLLTNATLSVDKRNQKCEDHKSAIMRKFCSVKPIHIIHYALPCLDALCACVWVCTHVISHTARSWLPTVLASGTLIQPAKISKIFYHFYKVIE
jgi:hypothetical protein